MNNFHTLIKQEVLEHVHQDEQDWLRYAFERYGSQYPTLQDIWTLMDEAWVENKCDPDVMDSRIGTFYRHPVWLLNGLFIEQHPESLENRRQFCDWVVKQSPHRVADYGGGFGGLARMIGAALPEAQIEVIEPHPHAAAIALAEGCENVKYQASLVGEYDVFIATDVFEHVPDPLALVAEASAHLKPGGQFLIANCFHPVIKCHLPSTFHFRWCWDAAMRAMGFEAGLPVCYGRAYVRVGAINMAGARKVETQSKRWFKVIERMPNRLRSRLARMLFDNLI